MNDTGQDKEFEAFLAGESRLDEQYRQLGHEEPPAGVDARIHAAAADAVQARHRDRGPRGGWLKPVALAATVLLSFSLVMNMVIDAPNRYEKVVTRPADTPSDDTVASREPRRPTPALKPSAIVPEIAADGLAAGAPVAGTMSADDEPDGSAGPLDEIAVQVRRAAELDIENGLLIVADYVATADRERQNAPPALFANARKAVAKAEGESKRPAPGARAQDAAASGDERDRAGDPESWLREIASLNAAGSKAAAADRLGEFVARYPDHPVSVKIRGRSD